MKVYIPQKERDGGDTRKKKVPLTAEGRTKVAEQSEVARGQTQMYRRVDTREGVRAKWGRKTILWKGEKGRGDSGGGLGSTPRGRRLIRDQALEKTAPETRSWTIRFPRRWGPWVNFFKALKRGSHQGGKRLALLGTKGSETKGVSRTGVRGQGGGEGPHNQGSLLKSSKSREKKPQASRNANALRSHICGRRKELWGSLCVHTGRKRGGQPKTDR